VQKTIVITGASRGIGFALAQQAAADGHTVITITRNSAPLENTKGITPFSVDLTDTAALSDGVEQIKSRFEKVDVLINNAGVLINRPFAQTSQADFQTTFSVNFFAVAALTQALLPHIDPTGHIVNISSMGGVLGSAKFPGLAAYSSSKGALITLTELLAEEYKATGPAFNALALGAVQTEMLADAFPGYTAPVTPEKMAEYILKFALEGHQFYNGKVLPVALSTP
jgi:3-oxoacyl-[acyl-carrier protein] reductase